MNKQVVVYDELENGCMLSHEVGEKGCIRIEEKAFFCLVVFKNRKSLKIKDYICVFTPIPFLNEI